MIIIQIHFQNSSAWECVFSHLFYHLLTYVSITYRYLFYSLGYIQYFSFCCGGCCKSEIHVLTRPCSLKSLQGNILPCPASNNLKCSLICGSVNSNQTGCLFPFNSFTCFTPNSNLPSLWKTPVCSLYLRIYFLSFLTE